MSPSMKRVLALSGPMGVGKSTVARLVAGRAGCAVIDVDAKIERDAGVSIAELFVREGEAAFRARERAVIDRLLEDDTPRVLALGGGAVTSETTRRALLHRAILVTLTASPSALVARIGEAGVAARPLLRDEHGATAKLESLLQERAIAYAEAHVTLDTEGRSAEEVASLVAAIWARDPVAVGLGSRTYRIEVGRGVIDLLGPTLSALSASRTLVVTDENVARLAFATVAPQLGEAPRVVLPAGEEHKTITSIEKIWDAALGAGLDRNGVIVAVGGGVVGDLTGFAAATLLRGVRVVQVPTTLLAMVDASVGGKTAIDRIQGKNLVGAFHQPSSVIADVDLLSTLPRRELVSGLAEVVKTALIGDAALYASLEENAEGLASGDPRLLSNVVRASIAHKAKVVAEDERETSGARAALNFGHTLGHALEAHGGYSALTHGEAVSVGMVYALAIGVALGVTPPAVQRRTIALLDRLGLPRRLDRAEVSAAFPFVAQDKKRAGAAITFVLVDEVGRNCLRKLSLDELRTLALAAASV